MIVAMMLDVSDDIMFILVYFSQCLNFGKSESEAESGICENTDLRSVEMYWV
jgi:hypothetical protein